jgi:hypothetical protein
VFGIQMHPAIQDSTGLQEALALNPSWIRFSAFHWDEIEPVRTEPPTYDWSAVRETSLLNAATGGMEMVAIVQYTPDWAQKVPGVYCGPIVEDRLDEFAQFLDALVRRYSVPPYNIKYWELGNEPDVSPSLVPAHSIFGCWGDENDPYYGGRYYGHMLEVAYPAIKAADPQAQVLVGGLLLDCDPRVPGACQGAHGALPPQFLDGILVAGGGAYFDLLSFHAYSLFDAAQGEGHMYNSNWPGAVTSTPEKTAFLRERLAAYGYAGKPLMNTESALLCSLPSDACFSTQAAYVPRAYAEALALDLDAQFYFALVNDGWHYTGLLSPDLTPRPAYGAYQAANNFLSAVEYLGEAGGYVVGVEGYSFRKRDGSGTIDMIWSVDTNPVEVSLPVEGAVYDMSGTYLGSGGVYLVDWRPVYVVWP